MTELSPATAPEAPAQHWLSLDAAWQEAFRQAWEAFRTGNTGVGACVTAPDGRIVRAARNRVADRDGPPGEVFGSALAHAEVNALARIPFRHRRELILTTTLEPCIQCSAAIRLGPVAVVRYAGADRLWDGCHDFSPLSPREAARPGKVTMLGPLAGAVGLFGTLAGRLGSRPVSAASASYLRLAGEAGVLDLAEELRLSGESARLAELEVSEAFSRLWPRLQELAAALAD